MNDFYFSVVMRDAKMNIVQSGRIKILADDAESAKKDLMDQWEKNWPSESVTDIELHQVETLTREPTIIRLLS